MPSLASERAVVQEPLIRYATEIGWVRLDQDDALSERGGEGGLFLYPTLRRKLLELNPGLLSPENVDQVIGKIEGARATIEGNAEVLAWLRGQRSVFVAAEKRERNVTLVDFDNIEHNVFNITDEWEYTNGQKTNRADVMVVINGIPVALVETKAATKPDGIDRGLVQVRRYHAETPEMVTAPQLFDVTHLINFYYGVTWSLDRKVLFNWKDEEPGNFERKVKRFFGRERFLKTLRDWIIVYRKDDELRKIVLRQHQARTVEKVVTRALDPEKARGLVWHTQGSGKTFTMITAAQQLLGHPAFANEKPTVIMLVDRNELQAQLFGNLEATGVPFQVATSKRRLRELLANDFRGLIVSMIHKFDGADADLSKRSNIFLLVDEAHRSTGGDLGNYLVAALPDATMIGFTGTPIDKTAYGKGTFKVFGRDDHPQGYLDKYSIAESIEDGTTLRLHYTLAPNEMLVPREQLEQEFFALAETEGVSDIEELNAILEKAVNLRAFLKAPSRIQKVAAFVAEHFRGNVEPLGYKAFLVAVDREACALYKHALDEHLAPEYSAVVYTSNYNDSKLLKEFALDDEAEKQVRKAFTKRDMLPKILIVTEKLLTGFDAPVLYCMYLDKPMRDHTLLQAIARVNRPYEEEGAIAKPSGFVLDFVGIFDNLEKALSFDSDTVSSVIENVDVLRERFSLLMTTTAQPHLALCRGRVDDKAAERAIAAFIEKEAREAFFEFFRELENLYEIISPDAFLRPYIDDYARLTALYAVVRNAYSMEPTVVRDLMRKTQELVQKHAQTEGLLTTLPVVSIDEKVLASIRYDDPDPSKVINLGKGILTSTVKEGTPPYLVSIGDRAEEVLEAFDDRQISTTVALQELGRLTKELLEAEAERKRLGLDQATFAILRELDRAGVEGDNARTLAVKLHSVFVTYPDYRDNPAQRRALKAELYRPLLPVVGEGKMVEVVEVLLRVHRGERGR
jgi:type I restriction enzyme R subunit